MDFSQEYQEKLCTPAEAVKVVKSGDWVDYSQTCSIPVKLDAALAARHAELADVNIRSSITMQPLKVVEEGEGSFTYNPWHCSGMDRRYIDQGKAFFNPMMFRNVGGYYRKGYAPVDVLMLTVSPMDAYGNFSTGLTNCCVQDIVDVAKYIILEVNPNMPRVYGTTGDHIHISQVDCLVESDEAIPAAMAPAATEIDRKIAEYIFPELSDGMTLQLGIGGMPNALGALVAESDLKDIGMHTELMSDGYLTLYKAGKITNMKKEIDRGKGVFSIANGSRELYDFLNENQGIYSAPIGYVNHPETIKQFKNFVSINGCIAMDLYGQVCSESAGTRHISGTGGQLDFVTGTFECVNGKAFLAMSSTFKDKKGTVHSRILPKFTQGDIITTPRTQVPTIVTEYGMAHQVGLPTWMRAENIINIAHPDFREDLIQAAEAQGIWRHSNKR